MEALRRSPAQEAEPEPEPKKEASRPARAKAGPDRRQRELLFPVPSGRGTRDTAGAEAENSAASRRTKKAG